MTPGRKRRDVLRGLAAGGLTSVAALAGCAQLPGGDDPGEQNGGDTGGQGSGDSGGQGNGNTGMQGGENELPSYHEHVPAEAHDSEGVSFVALDAARLRELEGRDLQNELPEDANVDMENEGNQEDGDPMLAYPGSGLLISVLGLSFGMAPYGFASDVLGGITGHLGDGNASGGGGDGADSPHRVDSLVTVDVGGAVVFDGSFDVGAVTDAAEGFEGAGERAGLEVYEGTGGGSGVSTENLAFAVDGSTLVALVSNDLDEPRAQLDHVIDVAAGDAGRLSGDDDGDWLLRTAGHGLVTIGGWGLDSLQEGMSQEQSGVTEAETVLADADGVASSLAVGEERVRATVAAVYPEGGTPGREQVEDDLGYSATDREVTVDGTRVSVTATWPTGEGTSASDPDSNGTETDTATPDAFETVVDEQLSASDGYMLDFSEGDEVRVTVENQEGDRTIVYMMLLGGTATPINDQTSDSKTWEVTIEEGGEYSVDFTVDGRANVTIEVARS